MDRAWAAPGLHHSEEPVWRWELCLLGLQICKVMWRQRKCGCSPWNVLFKLFSAPHHTFIITFQSRWIIISRLQIFWNFFFASFSKTTHQTPSRWRSPSLKKQCLITQQCWYLISNALVFTENWWIHLGWEMEPIKTTTVLEKDGSQSVPLLGHLTAPWGGVS